VLVSVVSFSADAVSTIGIETVGLNVGISKVTGYTVVVSEIVAVVTLPTGQL